MDRLDDDLAPGTGTADLRVHLRHTHALRAEWIDAAEAAEVHAIHRRLHGRAVRPDPTLVDVHLVEVRTDPDDTVATTLELAAALDHDENLIWLPMRVADLAHAEDAPGHTDRGGCRACADVVEAVVRGLAALDRRPARRIAALEAALATVERVAGTLRSVLDDAAAAVARPAEHEPDDPADHEPGSVDVAAMVARCTALLDDLDAAVEPDA